MAKFVTVITREELTEVVMNYLHDKGVGTEYDWMSLAIEEGPFVCEFFNSAPVVEVSEADFDRAWAEAFNE